MSDHTEELTQAARGFDEELDAAVRTYLGLGPAPFSELIRVLDQHLEVGDRVGVGRAVRTRINAGALVYNQRTKEVALPEVVTVRVELTCVHEKQYRVRRDQMPRPGEEHPCWSACDQVPTHHGVNPHVRRVVSVTELTEV